MSRIIAGKSTKAVAKLAKENGLHALGDPSGLYLQVALPGRSWIYRYRLNGRRRDMGLGAYIDIALEHAREQAREARKLVLSGVDPIDMKRQQRAIAVQSVATRMIFEACVDNYLDAHSDSWRSPKHRAQWRSTLDTYANPVLGKMDVAAIETAHVLAVLTPIWRQKTETAKRLRGRIASVLDWSRVRGYRAGDNPARWQGHLDKMLAKPSKIAKVVHLKALPYVQVAEFMQELRKQEGIGAAALEFTILTAARSGAVRKATWNEIDFEARTWTSPGAHMKGAIEHITPLSGPAVALLEKMEACRVSDFVFAGSREGTMLCDMTLTATLRRMGVDCTVHGFRSTFRDWCAETTNFPRELAETALAHSLRNRTEAAYQRGSMLAKRAVLMQAWADYCATPRAPATVLPLRRKLV